MADAATRLRIRRGHASGQKINVEPFHASSSRGKAGELNERRRDRRGHFGARRAAVRRARSFRSPSCKPSATRRRRSSACARASRTSPTSAASFRPTTSISPSLPPGEVTKTLAALKASPATAKAKAQVHPRDRRRRTSRPRTWRAARRSPAPTRTSRITSASSCRWPASRPSSRSAKAPSTSGRPAA